MLARILNVCVHLEDRTVHMYGLALIIFHGDPLISRFTEILIMLLKQVYTTTGFPVKCKCVT